MFITQFKPLHILLKGHWEWQLSAHRKPTADSHVQWLGWRFLSSLLLKRFQGQNGPSITQSSKKSRKNCRKRPSTLEESLETFKEMLWFTRLLKMGRGREELFFSIVESMWYKEWRFFWSQTQACGMTLGSILDLFGSFQFPHWWKGITICHPSNILWIYVIVSIKHLPDM